MKHKHCDVIKAWADGAQIQFRALGDNSWSDINKWTPRWSEDHDYRVKPEKKQLWVRPYGYTHEREYKQGKKYIGVLRFEQNEERWKGNETPVNDWEWLGPAVLVWEES